MKPEKTLGGVQREKGYVEFNTLNPAPSAPKLAPPTPETTEGGEALRIDGYRQVLEMLRVADDRFRESLLQRIASRDPRLARSLRAELG